MAGSLDFILPPPDARGIVDKTAEFVAKNGPEFEAKIKEKQGADVKFSFLEPDDPYHAYYREKVKRLEAGDLEGARSTFHRVLPLMVFERLYGVAIYKEVLHRRGIIGSTARRAPGPDIDDDDRRELEPALVQAEDLFRL